MYLYVICQFLMLWWKMQFRGDCFHGKMHLEIEKFCAKFPVTITLRGNCTSNKKLMFCAKLSEILIEENCLRNFNCYYKFAVFELLIKTKFFHVLVNDLQTSSSGARIRTRAYISYPLYIHQSFVMWSRVIPWVTWPTSHFSSKFK